MSLSQRQPLSWYNPIHWLALGFGTGLAPKAPGTFGTLVGIPVVLILAEFRWSTYLFALVLMTLGGIWVCQYTAKAMGEHDHPSIVWDEIVGYAIAMFALPADPAWLLAAFVVFRVLDIWKPGPIGWADKRLSGGSGIMMDDVMAGIMTAVLLHLTAWSAGLPL